MDTYKDTPTPPKELVYLYRVVMWCPVGRLLFVVFLSLQDDLLEFFKIGGGDWLAVDATFDLISDEGDMTEDEITIDDDGTEVSRTLVAVEFSDEARVVDVNSALQAVGGVIVSMLEGMNLFLVRIPDTGTLSGLQGVVAALELEPEVLMAATQGFFDDEVFKLACAAEILLVRSDNS